jgi:hypothetical protein
LKTRVLAALITVGTVIGAAIPAAGAQGFSRVPDGFKASLVDALESSCGGAGASAVATDGSTHYFAINGSLYSKRPQSPLRSYSGRVEPWGLALSGGSLIATQPGCDTSQANQAPGPLTDCDLVRVSAENGESLGTIADICGTGVAALGSSLAVATRDGRIVTVGASGGAVRDVATNLSPVATQLAWALDGGTIFFTRLDGDGVWSVPAGGGAVKRIASVAGRGLIAGTKALGAAGKLLVAGGGRLQLVRIDNGTRAEAGEASSLAGPIAAAGNTILVAMTQEAWVLKGAFPGPPPPPRTVSAPPAGAPPPPPAAPGAPPAALPPPPISPAPPPPPVPPAPPAPVQAFITQPSAVTNPALVPGQEDPEVALRHAATRRQPVASTAEVWLIFVVAATMIGSAGFLAGHSRQRRSPAWAIAGSHMTTRGRKTFIL